MWPLYKREYSHTRDEFIFKDKQTRYRKQALDFTPPQEFFVAEPISTTVAYNLEFQLKE
ncbi:hypothetical protein [Acinetobacter baumannii]|uniref:hypothetical protein n=1 Tax=Acinetobacter baumannii TaxID=470 RepID=UPI00321A549C